LNVLAPGELEHHVQTHSEGYPLRAVITLIGWTAWSFVNMRSTAGTCSRRSRISLTCHAGARCVLLSFMLMPALGAFSRYNDRRLTNMPENIANISRSFFQ
jgi:hypothetical protein